MKWIVTFSRQDQNVMKLPATGVDASGLFCIFGQRRSGQGPMEVPVLHCEANVKNNKKQMVTY